MPKAIGFVSRSTVMQDMSLIGLKGLASGMGGAKGLIAHRSPLLFAHHANDSPPPLAYIPAL